MYTHASSCTLLPSIHPAQIPRPRPIPPTPNPSSHTPQSLPPTDARSPGPPPNGKRLTHLATNAVLTCRPARYTCTRWRPAPPPRARSWWAGSGRVGPGGCPSGYALRSSGCAGNWAKSSVGRIRPSNSRSEPKTTHQPVAWSTYKPGAVESMREAPVLWLGLIYFENVLPKLQSTYWVPLSSCLCMLRGLIYNACRFELADILMLENIKQASTFLKRVYIFSIHVLSNPSSHAL